MPRTQRPASSVMRRHAPLVGMLAATLLALFVLPSALNVPLSAPTETLEFAPIPPEKDAPPPPSGNVGSLSLGTSAGPDAGGPGGAGGVVDAPPPPPLPDGLGDTPVTKRCVGSPPRQTEDPMSPPCVAHFEGDNGGATYQGVDADEIRVLFYYDGGIIDTVTSRGNEQRPCDVYVDLFDEPDDDDHYHVRVLRAYQRYFNERYQLYGRTAHFILYFTECADQDSSNVTSPETRRADAAENVEKTDPFAVLTYTSYGFEDAYVEAMASAGVLSFGSFLGREAQFFSRFDGLVWSYLPSIEQQVDLFVDHVCRKIVPYPVSYSGNGDSGGDRVLGLLRTHDETQPGMVRFAALARDGISACGGEFVHEGTYPDAGGIITRAGTENNQSAAATNIAEFQRRGVTTIVWPQGFEVDHSKAAARANYRPEWIVAGDTYHEGYQPSREQEQSVWDHAWVVSNVVRTPACAEQGSYRALSEADPTMPERDKSFECISSTRYQDLRMLFTAIQVAGPRLSPESVDRGLHAIPPVTSTDPAVPACFFKPGDFTCVKDGVQMWWDSQTAPPGARGRPGCWRMPEAGQRYFAGRWPAGDVIEQQDREADPCNGYVGGLSVSLRA